MKPEKFIGIILITILLSCETEEQQPAYPADRVDQKVGEVTFETNQYIINSSFDVDIFIDQKKIGSINNKNHGFKFGVKLETGVHAYEIKVYSYNGVPSKSIKGKFIIKENKKDKVFIDFTKYNSWM